MTDQSIPDRTIAGKRIVVTGGAGFLGSHVTLRLLEKDASVVVLDDFSNGKTAHLAAVSSHPRLEIVRGDVTDPRTVDRTLEGARMVIHLAVLCLRESIKDPHRVSEVIVRGTLNCLEAARDNDVDLFLNCSSSEVYGTAAYTPMDEAHPLNPETPYAAAKAAQDLYVASYGSTYGLPWTTLRPFNMYGPNSHWQGTRGELIPKMIVRASAGEPLVIFGCGDQTRDFLYVEDAAEALAAVAESPACLGETINLSTGTETTVRRIAELVCENCGLDPRSAIQEQPPRPADVQRHRGDNAKLRRLLGFEPRTGLEEGLAKTLAWFRALPGTPADLLAGERLRNWE